MLGCAKSEVMCKGRCAWSIGLPAAKCMLAAHDAHDAHDGTSKCALLGVYVFDFGPQEGSQRGGAE